MNDDLEEYMQNVEKNLTLLNNLLHDVKNNKRINNIDLPQTESAGFNQLISGINNLADEFLTVKSTLNEQNSINKLRIIIWQIAARKYLSDKLIIQSLLDLIGSFFKVSYASFYRYHADKAVCEIQWKKKAYKSTLGLTIPAHIYKQFDSSGHVLLYTSNIPGNLHSEIIKLFKKADINSFLAIPYKIKEKTFGFFSFSEKDPRRRWKDIEIEILKEVSKIISIKTMEIHAEDALMQVSERLDKKVAHHTLELQKANENMRKDIKRRKKIEKALRESEKLYRTLIFTSPNPVILTDLDLNITMVNRTALALSNIDYETLIIGKNILKFISEKDRLSVKNNFQALFEKENLFTGEFLFLKVDGTPYPAELNASIIYDSEEKPIAFLIVIGDLTAKKNVEDALEKEKELFEVTLRSISDAVVTISRDKKVVFLNRVAENLIFREQSQVIGHDFQAFFSFMSRNNSEYNERLITHLLDRGDPMSFSLDTQLVLSFGKKIPIAGSGSPIRSKDGTLIGAVLVFRDISEQKEMENELLRARNMDSLGVLAGGLAHDFNNILTGIITNISLAKGQISNSDEVKEFLLNAEHAALRASRLTNQLLTFAKGGAPVKESASIKNIITESASFCLSGANVECEFVLPDDLWSLEVDRGQMYQVLNNLIFNAKDAMPQGGKIILTAMNIEITRDNMITYGNLLKVGKYIKVLIQDEGSGIKEENLQKIFDPYFTTKPTGTGLGLTSAYSIIKKHGGYIHVESHPGIGTTFEFYLPSTGILPKTENTVLKLDFSGCGNILLMDDDEDVRKVVVRLLSKVGYHVISTTEGGQAIDEYKKAMEKGSPFDVVIMDLTVRGGMQGMDAVQEIRKYDPDSRIIIVSGYSNATIMSHYKEYGIKAVITKPFVIEAFLDSIKRICEE
ncbi:MAG: PAS domain S-box protein [Spirochaetales bacterium]|nr:PAS domain S-box protein [Spirochaetales bacterium]